MAPAFIITLDTEGDNLWSRPRTVTTRNAASLPAFQALAEKFGFRPTWLVNWEMAHAPACREFLQDVLARGTGEVGLHLHAWDTPPLESLTGDDSQHHPFLGEYPEPLMRAKMERLAGALEDAFQQPLRSHRAGRWAFDGRIARWLREHGFTADCSVCPGIDWRSTKGDPQGTGGPDYRGAPSEPYYLDERNVIKPATSPTTSANAATAVVARRWVLRVLGTACSSARADRLAPLERQSNRLPTTRQADNLIAVSMWTTGLEVR